MLGTKVRKRIYVCALFVCCNINMIHIFGILLKSVDKTQIVVAKFMYILPIVQCDNCW